MPYEPSDDADPVAPECRATVDAIQRALDGDVTPASLAPEPHFGACAACRERLRAVRVLLSVLATPGEPVPVSADFTDRVVNAVLVEGRVQIRRRLYKTTAWMALAAAVLLAAFVIAKPTPKRDPIPSLPGVGPGVEMAELPAVAPAPREKAPLAPDPRPMHLRDEVTKAGQVFRDTPKPIADSVAVAPKLFDAFAGAFTKPAGPAAPMGDVLEPARKSLSDLPDAARHGFEPVTGTAQKAFDRLLRDVASVKPKS